MIKLSQTREIKKASDITIPKGMRNVKYGVAHTTASPQKQSIQAILNHWEFNNKWTNVGYHFIIEWDGKITELANIGKITNGVQGYNSNSIHFTYIGGIDSKGNPFDNRTEAQKQSQLLIINRLKELFPNLIFLGHRDFSTDKNGNGIIDRWEWIKSCPSFDLREWLSKMGLDKKIEPERIVYKLNTPLIKNDTATAIQLGLHIDADGWFGSDTDIAVRDFQKNNKLTVDGIVGEGTAKLLAKHISPEIDYKGLKGSYYIGLLNLIKNK